MLLFLFFGKLAAVAVAAADSWFCCAHLLACQTLQVPCHLQSLETTKAQQIFRSQMSLLSSIPDLMSVSTKFKIKHFFTCTDKFPANFVAEKFVQSQYPEWGLSHTVCGVHEVSACEKSMATAVSGHISGMLSLGLSTRHAGVLKELRQVLYNLFVEHLEVLVGVGICKQHRLAMYDLFLPVGIDSPATKAVGEYSKSCKKRSTFVNQRRRLIISTYLNGDITEERLVHYTSGFRDRDDILLEIKKYLIPELLPTGVPLVNRNKWLGTEEAMSFFGLLLCHHNLLPRMMKAWKKSSQEVAAAPDSIAEGPDLGPNWSSWAEAVRRKACPNPSLPSLPIDTLEDVEEEDEDQFKSEPVFDPVTGDVDWTEFRKATLGKALAWCDIGPRDVVILITAAFNPIFRLMTDAIWLGSEAFEKAQNDKASRGEMRSYRVLELYLGSGVNAFKRAMNRLFHEPLDIWPASAQVCHMRTLFFRVLSRSMCSVEQIYGLKHRHPPFTLYGALWGLLNDLRQSPPCLYDSLTQWFVKEFGIDGLCGQDAQNLLAACASISQHDITGIETRHASIRRVLLAKSVNCWAMAFADLSADFLCRQHVILQECLQFKPKPKTTQGGSVKRQRQRRGGGPWRAFIHCNYQGQYLSDDLAEEASLEYHKVKNAGGPEWDFYVNLGLLGTLAGRKGVQAFPSYHDRKRDQAMEVAVAGNQLCLCKLEADLQELRLQRRRRDELEETYQAERFEAAVEVSALVQRELESNCQLDTLSLMRPPNQSCLRPDEDSLADVFFAFPGTSTTPARLQFQVPATKVAIAPRLISRLVIPVLWTFGFFGFDCDQALPILLCPVYITILLYHTILLYYTILTILLYYTILYFDIFKIGPRVTYEMR